MASLHGWTEHFERVHEDLRQIFGQRLRSLVAYESHFGLEGGAGAEGPPAAEGDHAHAMAVVDGLTYTDLVSCAAKVGDWEKLRVGAPLLLTEEEFTRSLDAFPLELGAIAAHHVLVAGSDPFEQVQIDPQDIRRACEAQAKSHLLHLREGFLEARGEAGAVARLVAASVPSFRTLLLNLARLDGQHARSREALVRHAAAKIGVPEALLDRVLAVRRPNDMDRADTPRVFAAYLDAVERTARMMDEWKAQ